MNSCLSFFVLTCLFQIGVAQYLGRMNSPAGCAPGGAVATSGFGHPGLSSPYGPIGGYGYGPGFGPYGAAPYSLSEYGGSGEGNVGIIGELPVAGTTAVAGQVPILGAVRFVGDVAAGGAVTITGNCACGCNAPYGPGYLY